MNESPAPPTYHVLLVGIDRYPVQYPSLAACVNDIDAVEALLLDAPGVNVAPGQIRITRLAASAPGHQSTSRYQENTRPPTKENLVQALMALSGPAVQPQDRVLIYYAGHGDERLWSGNPVWHEALVPHNDLDIEYLFDVEINALITAIAVRTSDLTVVLDCCHSAGATRGLDGEGAVAHSAARSLGRVETPVQPPDLSALGVPLAAGQSRGGGAPLLQHPSPDYLVVVACQPHEKANEGAVTLAEQPHGVFTHSLLRALAAVAPERRSQVRWSDIWPDLLQQVVVRNDDLGQPAQHPWLIGRSERRVLGGPWQEMDAGYTITRRVDGSFTVGAGRLMGVTEGARIAVYGDEPRFFPAIGTDEDRPVGWLQIATAADAQAQAVVDGADFDLPDGARGRLVRPGASEQLRVAVQPADREIVAALADSPLLALTATPTNAEVIVSQVRNTWVVGNDVEPAIAVVPVGEVQALRAGLEHYYRYNTVLRMATRCTTPGFSNALSVKLLDCNNPRALAILTALTPTDPLPNEAPYDGNGVYALPEGFSFCVRVANESGSDLLVSLLNCSAAGMVEYLGDRLLRRGAAEIIWLDDQVGEPLVAGRDTLPVAPVGITRLAYATERIIAIGTSRLDVNLRSLKVAERVQEIVERHLTARGDQRMLRLASRSDSAPVDLWAATVTPMRIG